MLIQHGANVYLTDNKGWLPLDFAALRGFPALGLLFQNESDLTDVDSKGRTLLPVVAKSGSKECFEFLVHHGNEINARDFRGQTVFGFSLQSNLPYFVKYCIEIYLEYGGDISAVDLVTGQTMLHAAAGTDFIAAVDTLLKQGLDLGARDKNGNTPMAAARGTPEMVQRLVDRGADLSAVNNRGLTPFQVCIAPATFACVNDRMKKN